jgi:hypothetical protein
LSSLFLSIKISKQRLQEFDRAVGLHGKPDKIAYDYLSGAQQARHGFTINAAINSKC